ncbi:MAG TPA: hypothetical protein ENH80_05495 [Phycisphaerae bacterium]|nr:hypothetical protein [Phycisphaerae bacterium]HDZ43381.1 hypothetical protein [Phycisphaerae bacterium]
MGGVCLIVGAVCLSGPWPAAWIIGAALGLFHVAFDACDGEIARVRREAGAAGDKGMTGYYLDTLMHGLETSLAAGIGYRLYVTSHMGVWPLILAAAAMVAVCTAPYLAYCKTLSVWLGKHGENPDDVHTLMGFVRGEPSIISEQRRDEIVSLRRCLLYLKQTLTTPGYFLTLPLAVCLDVFVGPLATSGDVVISWRFIWLAVYVAGKVLYSLYWGARLAVRLRELPA